MKKKVHELSFLVIAILGFVTDGTTGPIFHPCLHPHPLRFNTALWLGYFGKPDFWEYFLSCASAFIMGLNPREPAAGGETCRTEYLTVVEASLL